MTTSPIRWGIIGPGGIARRFAADLKLVPDTQLVAVGSRSQESADKFADEFGAPNRHASYADLANDPDVDVVYIATPHPFHHANALLCLQAGKAVLVEKPFTINARQAQEVVDTARSAGLFAMEAMWSRYIPLMVRLRELISEGAIGEVRMLEVDFGFRSQLKPEGRLYNLALGGGALLDVGVYNVSLASMLFGTPTRIVSMAHLGETGVDEQAGMVFGYPEGRLAVLSSAIRTTMSQEAFIMGAEGRIRLHSPWWKPSRLTLTRPNQDDIIIDMPVEGFGFHHEAAEVVRCLREGRLESATMPLDETVAIMSTLDELRAQWGLKYPME